MASFFFHKNRWWLVAYRSPHPAPRLLELSVAREIIRPQAGRRTEHLVAVNENAAPMARGEFPFVRRNNGSASGAQAKNQPAIRSDTNDTTAHQTSVTPRGVWVRTPAGAGASGF